MCSLFELFDASEEDCSGVFGEPQISLGGEDTGRTSCEVVCADDRWELSEKEESSTFLAVAVVVTSCVLSYWLCVELLYIVSLLSSCWEWEKGGGELE